MKLFKLKKDLLFTNLCVKLVVTEVEGSIDGFKRLKVDVDLLLFPFFCHDGPAVDDQAVGRN